jgi:hypothetical protein
VTKFGALLLLAASVLGAGCEGCMRRVPASQVDLADWPACATTPPDERLVARELVAGPIMREQTVVERYSIARHGECLVGRVFLRWMLGDTALEVVWDRELNPVAAYKRMSYPGEPERFEERGYRMSDTESVMVRVATHEVERFRFRGARPTAVVPTGRGLFSVLFRRHLGLEVGESARESVIDLRRLVERIEPGNVRRDPARDHEFTDEPLLTFTFMGRDTIFVDSRGFVMGDLAGLVATDAELEDAFEGVSPVVDASAAWARLRAVGLELR